MILLDTSGLLAALDSSQRLHSKALLALGGSQPPLLLSPFVLAELDHLLATRVGRAAQRALLKEVGRGAYDLEAFSRQDVVEATAIMDRHADLDIGLADASIVVLAQRHRTSDVLTLDERHFRALRDSRGRPFRLLPADLNV